ncbi:MAG: DUF4114 domain-containing protein [Flavobacterium sp.]|uniref:DUF4114 domain-containing protein n=1 Tax=Flavobacterium sp. TaxID=239 RepID=UPI0022BB5ACF|nr:DUF4114 domain-containing protein [Flavobacterium sp.]MCZ8196972.1 DUF4114 domain-containing protein [Flavobacterium sp.]
MKRIVLLITLFSNFTFFAQSYQFLGSYTSDGTPLYFVTSDVISSQTMSLINNSLPENYPVPTYNPQYISSGYETDIIIDSLADVWVTFVSEGAGYKNVLGFYTYDINNPPTTAPTASQITIVFPNVSAQGSGGSLVAGNKVKIGTFPAGTGIGWVLLANAWNGSSVTNGLWRLFSNPNFNPESNPSLRQHNVLLNDPDNQRVILGFEDIRRDYGSCDNDFNDAIFYVSANPYEAMRSSNLADVSSATDVSSGNNGGLESKGDLATLIAKRNFNRIKTNSSADTKDKQTVFSNTTPLFSKSNTTVDFSTLIPTTGMFGTETSYVSTPADLLGITNALEVYSVDYYQNSTRVAAVLATSTTGGIYGHSKAICDRLNNSTLEDVRTIQLNGYEIIMVKIKRANGAIEFALNFSVQQLISENKLHSYWNINQYPTGDYLNFQVWGSTMGQVSSITNYILNQFQSQSSLIEDVVTNRIPTVFVKKGSYRNGNLYLKLINKSNSSTISFSGNKKATELATLESMSQSVSLTSAYEQDLVINTGGIFDIGFSINGNNSPQIDALYLADGPWGLDYATTETTITDYSIQNSTNTVNTDEYSIERNVTLSGEVYGTANIFRNILPGELTFDATNYAAVSFSIQNSLPVEVVLVTENTTDWNNRLRIQLPENATNTDVTIAFSDFTNALGQTFANEKIKGFVFSTIGNYSSFQPFNIAVSNLKLGNNSALSNQNFENLVSNKIYNYPNPCQSNTTIVLPSNTESAEVKIVDVSGKVIQNKKYTINSNSINIDVNEIAKGIYIFEVITNEGKDFKTKVVIQ